MKNKNLILYSLVFLIFGLVFTGCRDSRTEPDSEKLPAENPKESKTPAKEDEDEKIIEEFKLISKDSPEPHVLIKFINENIEKTSTQNSDEMIGVLLTSLESNKQTYEDRIFKLDKDNELIAIGGLETDFKKTDTDEIKNEKLRIEVDYLYSNIYKLVNLEGAFYPIIDYNELKTYNKFIGEELKSYIDLKSLESENRSMADAGLTINFDELAQRIFKTEDYLKNSLAEVRRNDILEDYKYKIDAYLKGLPNTPIMDYETKQIKEDVLKSYKNTANREYEISKAVEKYLQIIENKDNIINEEVLQEADELITKTLSTFKSK